MTHSKASGRENTAPNPEPFVQTDPPKWASPDLWRPRTTLRRAWGTDFTLRRRQMDALVESSPEILEYKPVPVVYYFCAEGWATTLPWKTHRQKRAQLYEQSLTVGWKDASLVFRGIHAGDAVTFCKAWTPIVGEVVLVQQRDRLGSDKPSLYAGVYRREGGAEWLEYDGLDPWGRLEIVRADANCPFDSIWPVAEVQHTIESIGDACLSHFPPECFQPWWEANDDDRRRYAPDLGTSGVTYIRPTAVGETPRRATRTHR